MTRRSTSSSGRTTSTSTVSRRRRYGRERRRAMSRASMAPAMKGLAKRLDPAEYGGALLLGVKAPFIICHGSSKAKAIKNAIGVAIDFAERDVVEHIAGNIVKSRKGNEEI